MGERCVGSCTVVQRVDMIEIDMMMMFKSGARRDDAGQMELFSMQRAGNAVHVAK